MFGSKRVNWEGHFSFLKQHSRETRLIYFGTWSTCHGFVSQERKMNFHRFDSIPVQPVPVKWSNFEHVSEVWAIELTAERVLLKARNWIMFKVEVFLLLCHSAFSINLGETPARLRKTKSFNYHSSLFLLNSKLGCVSLVSAGLGQPVKAVQH